MSQSAAAGTIQTVHWWIRAAYLQAAVLSALGHIYVMMRMSEESGALGFMGLMRRMCIPSFSLFPFGSNSATEILVNGPWLFLQWDHIIIGASSLSWAFILITNSKSPLVERLGKWTILFALLGGSLVLGTGPVVSFTLFLREGSLMHESLGIEKHV